jgi:murein L,D-transpeptidase YcbB/YkuD
MRSPAESALNWKRIRAGYYDTTLQPLVAEFQRNNGLAADGVLGKRTIECMNIPPAQRADLIRLNLDRCRWFDYPDSARYVRVNIPDFHVYLCDSGRELAKIKVCVGMRWLGLRARGFMPMTYQTPVLRSEVQYMVLNPTWSVPESIAEKETYLSELHRPGYLSRNNYRVYRGDSIVDPSTVDWTKYKGRNLPFRFVQAPGAGNALGRIKFLFNNPYDVYMHDTPKRLAFNLAQRTVSHGCIRVQEPMRVVSFLFPDDGSWTLASTRSYLAATRTTKWITLPKRIPIWVDYATAWIDADGGIQFRDDIYRKDLLLKQDLPPLHR